MQIVEAFVHIVLHRLKSLVDLFKAFFSELNVPFKHRTVCPYFFLHPCDFHMQAPHALCARDCWLRRQPFGEVAPDVRSYLLKMFKNGR